MLNSFQHPFVGLAGSFEMQIDPEEERKGPSGPMLWLIGIIIFVIIGAGTILSKSDQQKACEEQGGVFVTSYRGPTECITKDEGQ